MLFILESIYSKGLWSSCSKNAFNSRVNILKNSLNSKAQLFKKSLHCREYYWANYGTGLGSTLHELGHTFDLAHTPSGIMARGFDDINQFFSVSNNKTGQQSKRTKSNRNDIFGSFVTKSGKVVGHVQFADSRSNRVPLLNVCFTLFFFYICKILQPLSLHFSIVLIYEKINIYKKCLNRIFLDF